MRRRLVRPLFTAAFLLLWVSPSAESAEGTLPAVEEFSRYARFGGFSEILPAEFEYPRDWRVLPDAVEEGAPYTQVLILGPRNLENTFTSTLVIRRTPSSRAGGEDADSNALLARYKRELFNDSQVVDEHRTTVAGQPATDLTATYTIPAPAHHDLAIRRLPIRVFVRTVYLDHGPHIYELIYTSDERNFPSYRDSFEHLLESLRFEPGPAS